MAVYYYFMITRCVFCYDRSKRRKTDNRRPNRKKVICLQCDKVLNDDNTKYHHAAKHEGLAPSFRMISERGQQRGGGQTLLNFNKVASQNPQVSEISFLFM